MDPIDFRLKNAAKEGTVQVIGLPFKRIGFVEVCEALKNSPHYKTPLTGKNPAAALPSASGSMPDCNPRQRSASTWMDLPRWSRARWTSAVHVRRAQ
jgi:hypothetical protein